MKSDLFRENREANVVVAKKFHMKIQGPTTQARLQSQSNGILRQAKRESPEGDQQEEGTIRGRVWMMYRGLETTTYLILELQANVEIQTVHEVR